MSGRARAPALGGEPARPHRRLPCHPALAMASAQDRRARCSTTSAARRRLRAARRAAGAGGGALGGWVRHAGSTSFRAGKPRPPHCARLAKRFQEPPRLSIRRVLQAGRGAACRGRPTSSSPAVGTRRRCRAWYDDFQVRVLDIQQARAHRRHQPGAGQRLSHRAHAGPAQRHQCRGRHAAARRGLPDPVDHSLGQGQSGTRVSVLNVVDGCILGRRHAQQRAEMGGTACSTWRFDAPPGRARPRRARDATMPSKTGLGDRHVHDARALAPSNRLLERFEQTS